jgi:hypothetical protein
MDKSVQQLMDERMCRPGYRWNSTLKRCLAAGGYGNGEFPETPPVPDPDIPEATPEPPPGQKPGVPAQPAKGKGGRGSVRVNANGITQTGTGMGKAISLK